MTADALSAASAGRARTGSANPALRDALHTLAAFLLIGLAIAAFLVSTPFGVCVTFLLTLGIATVQPAGMPVIIITAFMFQNVIIAALTPLVPGDDAFDSLKGANFVVLVSAYGAFLIASFQQRVRPISALRPWLIAGIGLLLVICFYLALGTLTGEPRDAVVYFRNTVAPLACLHVALVSSSLYRVDLGRTLVWLGAVAIAYGYCELFFTLDFLSLFNGDLYLERNFQRQLESGMWEEELRETGFVLRGMRDVMTTTFFNTPFFKDLMPPVFRIGGPNFHAISYAYALTVISIWQVMRGRWLLLVFAAPLLMVIGSKGAMAMLLLAIFLKLALRVVPARLAMVLFLGLAGAWITAAVIVGAAGADYHVLGFLAGMKGFAENPLGQGLGIGGNLSSSSEHLDWDIAQASGITDIPVESAIGVMLYQMGVGGFAFIGFLFALGATCRGLYLRTGNTGFLFGFATIAVISCNAVLQEEAFFSPLALGLCLILVGTTLGTYWRERSTPR